MSEVFLSVVNMSISAGWIVLAVLVLRLLIKKAPKWITVLLWAIVAIRLICPFSIESAISLVPSAETISPEIIMESKPSIDTGIPIINSAVNPIIEGSFAPEPSSSTNLLQIWIPILSIIWIAGIVLMLGFLVISYLRVKNKIGTAVLLRDNIFQSESVVFPFVLGIVKPKIYIPFNMNEQDVEQVLAHENAHIRRRDYLWKPLGFLILTLHWFNPLMWLSYVLLCRDIELACDEKVIKELDAEQKADYSKALLLCSVNRRIITACPLAFGEVGVKNRVKAVLSYKKPAFWIILVAILVSIVTAACFLTSPAKNMSQELCLFIEEKIMEHNRNSFSNGEFFCTDFTVLGTEKNKENTTVYLHTVYYGYNEKNGEINIASGGISEAVITVKKVDSGEKYELVEYWEPRDGTIYQEDIKAKFPWYLYFKTLSGRRYSEKERANCDKKAQEYFKSSEPTISREYSKDGALLLSESLNNRGKIINTTHFDVNGKKVAEVEYDEGGNKTYTYYYEDGTVAPARTYDISWSEDGSYLYTRLYYRQNGSVSQVNIYRQNGKLYYYRKYNTKNEVTEEAFYGENGEKEYCTKFNYKYRSNSTISEQVLSSEDGTQLQTNIIDEQGQVTKSIYIDGWSETYEQKYNAGIYYTPSFSSEY